MTIREFERVGYVPLKQAVKGSRVVVWDGSRIMLGEIAKQYLREGWRVRICREPDAQPRRYEYLTDDESRRSEDEADISGCRCQTRNG